MRIEKGTGIYLDKNEARVFQGEEQGWDYWHPDFQELLHSSGECSRFFPHASRPEGKNGPVLFSLKLGDWELVSRSRRVRGKVIPPEEIRRLRVALEQLQKRIESDPISALVFDSFRLPSPEHSPHCYRLYGPWWQRRLLVLWGFDSFDASGAVLPTLPPEDALAKLASLHSSRFYLGKLFLKGLLHLLLVVAVSVLITLGFQLVRLQLAHRRAQLENTVYCHHCHTPLSDDLCPFICLECGVHLPNKVAHCPYCRILQRHNRTGRLKVAPATLLAPGEVISLTSEVSGVISCDGWAPRHAEAGETHHFFWDEQGRFAVSFHPDQEGLPAERLNLHVLRKQQALAPERHWDGKMELLPRKVATGEFVIMRDLTSLGRKLDWGDGTPLVPMPRERSLGHLYPKIGIYHVRLLDETDGVLGEGQVEVTTLKYLSGNLMEQAPYSIQLGGEVAIHEASTHHSIVRRQVRWGREQSFAPVSDMLSVHSFDHPHLAEMTLRLWRSDGMFLEETRLVKVVDDAWQVILSIDPNPVMHGGSFVLRDESVIPPGRQVVLRQLRWLPSREYETMDKDNQTYSFPQSGVRKVVVRLLDDQGEFHYGQAGVTIQAQPDSRLSP